MARLAASTKREVRLALGGGTVWAENNEPLQVEVRIEQDPVPEPFPGGADPSVDGDDVGEANSAEET